MCQPMCQIWTIKEGSHGKVCERNIRCCVEMNFYEKQICQTLCPIMPQTR